MRSSIGGFESRGSLTSQQQQSYRLLPEAVMKVPTAPAKGPLLDGAPHVDLMGGASRRSQTTFPPRVAVVPVALEAPFQALTPRSPGGGGVYGAMDQKKLRELSGTLGPPGGANSQDQVLRRLDRAPCWGRSALCRGGNRFVVASSIINCVFV